MLESPSFKYLQVYFHHYILFGFNYTFSRNKFEFEILIILYNIFIIFIVNPFKFTSYISIILNYNFIITKSIDFVNIASKKTIVIQIKLVQSYMDMLNFSKHK